MREFVDTERSYITKLTVIRSVFLEPLTTKGILKPEQLRFVFSDIVVIEETNRRVVLEAAEKWKEETPSPTPGDVFEELSSNVGFLRAYQEYVNNFDASVDTIKKLKTEPHHQQFLAFLESAQKEPRCEGLNLESLLIMPVQRIPRYILLVKELLKHTTQESPDHAKLTSALERISKIATEINTAKSDAQSREMVVTLESQLVGLSSRLIAEPSRRFVKEAVFVLVEDGGAPVDAWHHRRHLVAFNDLLVICRAKTDSKGRRQVVDELPMGDLRIASTTQSGSNIRVLIITSASKKVVMAFASLTNSDTDAWIELLKQSIETLKRKSLTFSKH